MRAGYALYQRDSNGVMRKVGTVESWHTTKALRGDTSYSHRLIEVAGSLYTLKEVI